MKKRFWIPLLAAGLVLFAFWGPGRFFTDIFWQRWDRVRLLSKTDHQALLEAGRDILRQIPMEPDRNDNKRPLPDGVQIPETIRKLRPRGIRMSTSGYLVITMHGGMGDYLGVRVYPEAFVAPWPSFAYGRRKLLDGLWYWDGGFSDGGKGDQYIDGLIAKNKHREHQQAGDTPVQNKSEQSAN